VVVVLNSGNELRLCLILINSSISDCVMSIYT
jgi:hypothetical protein